MTDKQKIDMVKALSDEVDEDVISAFLGFAGSKLYSYGDPFGTMTESAFLELHPDVQIDAAAYMLNKRGWDYQVVYTENGVRREYETGDLPSSILARIAPICAGVK